MGSTSADNPSQNVIAHQITTIQDANPLKIQLLKDPKSYNLGLRFYFEKMPLHTMMTKIDDGNKE